MPTGNLKVQVFQGNSYKPVENAVIKVVGTSYANVKQNAVTDSSGTTNEVELETPPIQYSQVPSKNIPYSLYDVSVEVPGYNSFMVKGCQVYPERVALQECRLQKTGLRQGEVTQINVSPNVLVGNYPRKIPESPIKIPAQEGTGFVVLNQAVVPEYIVVHAGDPNNTSAPNYTIRYRDYIKNVASSEIFSTWPESTIRANVYCIVSFTLNRVFTEWYKNKGKNFTVTNSTAYDQAFNYGRTIYANISRIVDELFATYVKRPTLKQPLLTQYCDGINVQCPGWLTQWGSKYLGDKGYTPYNILTHFYGTDLNLAAAPKVSGIPSSYPGYTLRAGSSGLAVSNLQRYLNAISNNYPAIPKQRVDGVYGTTTKKAVTAFQKIFNLYPTGEVNYPTWYRISDIYVAVKNIAELRSIN
ncbi:MAG: peptidoglycan-binding domain-containing protein, partial [Bacillota bacterium]|nr:peptidoglycan-binding domain-containing protein [Bacillota bacterium]